MKQLEDIKLYGEPFVQIATFKEDFRLTPKMTHDACLAYVKAGKYEIFSASEHISATYNESILMKCGNYIADFQQDPEEKFFRNIVFHLYPESIKRVFNDEDLSFLMDKAATSEKGEAVKITDNALLNKSSAS